MSKDADTPQWAMVLMGVLGGLLVITILYGIFTMTLGATTIALSLMSLLGGLVTGLLARRARSGDDNK